MFLNNLNQEEKRAFLALAHYVARSDGNFSEEEEEVISTYCFEMQIEDIEYNKDDFDLQNNLSIFSSRMSQKVLLLELMALIYSDQNIDSSEEEILNIIIQTFNINISLAKIYAEWTKSILAITAQGKLLLDI